MPAGARSRQRRSGLCGVWRTRPVSRLTALPGCRIRRRRTGRPPPLAAAGPGPRVHARRAKAWQAAKGLARDATACPAAEVAPSLFVLSLLEAATHLAVRKLPRAPPLMREGRCALL